jgi:hypothetical protein
VSAAQHLVAEVEPDTCRVGSRREHERERHPVARAEIEHAVDARRQQLAQHLEGVDAVRQRLPIPQVRERVLLVDPQVRRHLTVR